MSDASSVISGTAASAHLTGHPAFASWAALRKVASSIPGTMPTGAERDRGDRQCSIDEAQRDGRVSLHRRGRGARVAERSRERHRAAGGVGRGDELLGIGARAILERDLNEYSPPMLLPAMNVPLPDLSSPCHSALPFAAILGSFSLALLTAPAC